MLETMGIYVMGVIFVISVLAKMISYVTVRRMEKASSEIQKSNHRLMKLIKAKFEHASMISDKVQNVEAFVEKYLYEYRIMRIKLWTFRSFQAKAAWIIALLGGVLAFSRYRAEGMGASVILYIEWTCIFVLGITLLHFLLEEETRIRCAKNYMVEYLENVCIRRFEKNNEKPVVEEVSEPEIVIPTVEELEPKKKSDQEIRIRAILEEFMA